MADIDSIEPGRDDRMRGPLCESHVDQNLSAILAHNGPQAVRLGDRLLALPIARLLA